MNILISNAEEFDPQIGGVPKVATILAKELTLLGHKVFFAACIKSKYSKSYKPAAEQILLPEKVYDSILNIEMLQNFCIDKNVDLILNLSGTSLRFIRLCANVSQRLKIPLISSIRMNPMFGFSQIKDLKFTPLQKISYLKSLKRILLFPVKYIRINNKYKALYKELCTVSDKVVLLSKRYVEELEYFVGSYYRQKTISIENPIIPELPYKPHVKDNTVLFVGRLEFYQKRPDRLICIWERLFKDYPGWKLKFAGDGPMKQDLEEYVRKKKIKNVEFLGFCNPVTHYETASILCMTSSMEGFGNVIMEGCSYGCIPVAFDSFKAIFDFIENGKNGFIIKSYKLRDYEAKLRNLLDNAELRTEMSASAKKSSLRFAPEKILPKWECLFKDLINTH